MWTICERTHTKFRLLSPQHHQLRLFIGALLACRLWPLATVNYLIFPCLLLHHHPDTLINILASPRLCAALRYWS